MTHSIYAACGTAMLIAAASLRTVAGGGWQLAVLLVVGFRLVIASGDHPARGKRRADG